MKKFIYFIFFAFFLSTVPAVFAAGDFSNPTFYVKNTTLNKGSGSPSLTATSAENGDTVSAFLILTNSGADPVTPSIQLAVSSGLNYTASSLEKSTNFGVTWTSVTDTNFVSAPVSLGSVVAAAGGKLFVRFKMNVSSASTATYNPMITISGGASDVTKTAQIKVPMANISSVSESLQQVTIVFGAAMKNDATFTNFSNYSVSVNTGAYVTATAISGQTTSQATLTFPASTFVGSNSLTLKTTGLLTNQNVQLENAAGAADGVYVTKAYTVPDVTAATIVAAIYQSNMGANGTLQIEFSEAMQTGDLTTANIAARVTLNNGHTFGTGPTISWTSSSKVRISMGTTPTITAGDTITIGTPVRDLSSNDSTGKTKVVTAGTISDAPTVTAFTIGNAAIGSKYYAGTTININSFTGADTDGTVVKYQITETSSAPTVVSFSLGAAPATHALVDAATQGIRTLYAWVLDNANVVSVAVSDTFTLDTVIPTIAASPAAQANTAAVTVTLTQTDTNVGTTYYTTDGTVPDNTDTLYAAPISVNSADGTNVTLKFIAYDLAGNTSAVGSEIYTYSCAAVANGTTGAYPACALTCNLNYTDTAGACVADTQACSITNGTGVSTWTGAAWGVCTVSSCNSGYNQSGNTCVSSGGGGGGGGGGGSVDLTSVYNIPQAPSDNVVTLPRPVASSTGEYNRKIILEEYYLKSHLIIEQGTLVTTEEGEAFTGEIKPITKLSIKSLEDVTLPSGKTLVYGSVFPIGTDKTFFSKPVTGYVVLPAALKKHVEDNPDTYEILSWDFVTKTWKSFGGKEKVEDGKVMFDLSQSTYLLLVLSDAVSIGGGKENIVINAEQQKEIFNNLTDIQGHWGSDYISQLYARGAVNGVGDTKTFQPDATINRAAFLKIIMELFDYDVSKVNLENIPFEDVSKDDWFAPYVLKAYQEGAVKGYEEKEVLLQGEFTSVKYGDFDKNNGVMKLQTALYRLGYLDIEPTGFFGAVTLNALKAYQQDKGLPAQGVFGPMTIAVISQEAKVQDLLGNEEVKTRSYFKPSANINRAEALIIMFALAGVDVPKATSSDFEDVPLDAWFADYVSYAKVKGIVNGKSATLFAPADFLTRAEAAKIALNMLGVK